MSVNIHHGRLLRPRDVMLRLNVSRSKAYDLIAGGHFMALKVDGSLRITEVSLQDYIRRQIAVYALENGVQDVQDRPEDSCP